MSGELLMRRADVDGPADAYLERLVEVAGDGLDRLFGACDGYPSDSSGSADRLAFLRAHLIKNDAVYVNTIGRTVEQIRQIGRLVLVAVQRDDEGAGAAGHCGSGGFTPTPSERPAVPGWRGIRADLRRR